MHEAHDFIWNYILHIKFRRLNSLVAVGPRHGGQMKPIRHDASLHGFVFQ